ncbi:phosphodiesterase [Halobacteriales archaeon QS_1_68_20]|nr:MAG: phosphodiesterase [Halobacteriales archaeon QS_1_68_20]
MTERETQLRTLVVGLDAACRRVLEPLLDAGAVPTLSSLFDEGVAGPLQSQVPPWTASAWPSLYTGANPGKHGVFGFLSFDGYDWNVVDATHVREHTLWELAHHHGLTSVVVNGPITYPPQDVDGAIVPGYTAPEDPECHPPGLLDELRDEVGEYRLYPTTEGREDATRDERIAEYRDLARMRGGAFRYLADRFDPEFGFLQFQVTDTVCHELPGDERALRAVYGAVDEHVGEVLEASDPDTVMVVSDHGIGEYHTRFRVNEYLRDHGYVEAVRGGEGMPTWSTIRDDRLRDGADAEDAESDLIERALSAAARVGLTSQRVGAVLDRLGLLEPVRRRVPDGVIRAASEQVDFAASRAYVRSRVECGVRINLAGREPDGIVPGDEYEAVREDLIARLSAATTPDGDPVFDEVVPREAYFWGPEADRAVDVVAVPAGFRHYLTTWLLGDRFADPERPAWDHRREGIVAAAWAGVDEGESLGDPHLFDVAPTVLATLDLPRSDRMDGGVLPFAEPAGERTYPEVERGRRRGTDDAATKRRLSRLGYVE